MTLKNIISGFKITGVCPLDRNAIEIPEAEENYTSFKPSTLPELYGFPYIPFYNPAVKQNATVSASKSNTCSLENKVESVYSNNPDCLSSESDFSNLEHSISEEPQNSCSILPLQQGSKVSVKPVKLYPKSCGRVLTSKENIERLEEKRKAKDEEQKKKLERRMEVKGKKCKPRNKKKKERTNDKEMLLKLNSHHQFHPMTFLKKK
jgi:hypothetical protein